MVVSLGHTGKRLLCCSFVGRRAHHSPLFISKPWQSHGWTATQFNTETVKIVLLLVENGTRAVINALGYTPTKGAFDLTCAKCHANSAKLAKAPTEKFKFLQPSSNPPDCSARKTISNARTPANIISTLPPNRRNTPEVGKHSSYSQY